MLKKFIVVLAAGTLCALPVLADSTGPVGGYDGIDSFDDVYTPPLQDSDWYTTTWGMHVTYAFTNYAGMLFDLQYDSHELSQVIVSPAGPHNKLEVPDTTGLYDSWEFPGSQSDWQVVFPLAVWVPGAAASGINVNSSSMYPLFNLDFHAKNTTIANNGDIDITASVWQILHIVESASYNIAASDYFYKTVNGIDWAYPGQGRWFHNPADGTTFIPASAFVATNNWINNVAGVGIEHVPEPAAAACMLLGVGGLIYARRRA